MLCLIGDKQVEAWFPEKVLGYAQRLDWTDRRRMECLGGLRCVVFTKLVRFTFYVGCGSSLHSVLRPPKSVTKDERLFSVTLLATLKVVETQNHLILPSDAQAHCSHTLHTHQHLPQKEHRRMNWSNRRARQKGLEHAPICPTSPEVPAVGRFACKRWTGLEVRCLDLEKARGK